MQDVAVADRGVGDGAEPEGDVLAGKALLKRGVQRLAPFRVLFG